MRKNRSVMKISGVLRSASITILVCFSFVACQMSTSPDKKTDIKLANLLDGEQWILKQDGRVIRVYNGSVSEEIKFPHPIVGLEMITNSTGRALDNQGILWRKNGTPDWQKLSKAIPSSIHPDLIRTFSFSDPDSGWLATPVSVWRTIDGGETWSEVFHTASALNDKSTQIMMLEAKSKDVTAIGLTSGYTFATTNGGVEWHKLSTGQMGDIRAISIVSPTHMFVGTTGGQNALFEITDKGNTLNPHNLGIETELTGVYSIYFTDPMHGWLLGRSVMKVGGGTIKTTSRLFATKDSGKTWQEFQVPNKEFFQTFFVDRIKGFLVGSESIFQTNDGGITWKPIIELDK